MSAYDKKRNFVAILGIIDDCDVSQAVRVAKLETSGCESRYNFDGTLNVAKKPKKAKRGAPARKKKGMKMAKPAKRAKSRKRAPKPAPAPTTPSLQPALPESAPVSPTAGP